MSRLIDADALRQVLEVYTEKDSLGHTPIQLCDAMPTVDAVEVVRCKDCKWSYDAIGGTFCSKGCCVDCEVDIDFFCADGERKEEK